MTWAVLVPRKGTEFPRIAKRAAKFIDQLGHNRVMLRCDNEPAIEALPREIAQVRQEGSQTVPERPPVGESQSNEIIERAVGLMNRCDNGSDGKTSLQRLHVRRNNTPILELGERILYMPSKPPRGGKWEPRFVEEESGSRGSAQECLLAC